MLRTSLKKKRSGGVMLTTNVSKPAMISKLNCRITDIPNKINTLDLIGWGFRKQWNSDVNMNEFIKNNLTKFVMSYNTDEYRVEDGHWYIDGIATNEDGIMSADVWQSNPLLLWRFMCGKNWSTAQKLNSEDLNNVAKNLHNDMLATISNYCGDTDFEELEKTNKCPETPSSVWEKQLELYEKGIRLRDFIQQFDITSPTNVFRVQYPVTGQDSINLLTVVSSIEELTIVLSELDGIDGSWDKHIKLIDVVKDILLNR